MAAHTFVTPTTSTSNVTSYASASFTPATDDLLVVNVMCTAVTLALSSVSLTNSEGITFYKAHAITAAQGSHYLFVAEQLAAATPQTVTFDCTGDAATGAIISIIRISGMSRVGAAATKQVGGAHVGAGVTPSFSFPGACQTNNPVLCWLSCATNPHGVTAPSGWTATADASYLTPTTVVTGYARNSGFTGTTLSWGSVASTATKVTGIELDTRPVWTGHAFGFAT